MDRADNLNNHNNIFYRRDIMIGETIINLMFWSIALWVCVRFNKDLHKDIFPSNEIPKRQWKFTNELDGKEYTIEEL